MPKRLGSDVMCSKMPLERETGKGKERAVEVRQAVESRIESPHLDEKCKRTRCYKSRSSSSGMAGRDEGTRAPKDAFDAASIRSA